MTRPKRPAAPAALDPEDVLSGRVKLTAVELLDLIHRVNPTGRDRGAREEALRYAQKSRLQSLLIHRFAESLEVVPDADREGTVSLHHRGHGRDGCHAVVAALDEDARAWVQLQLDLAAQPEPPRPPPPAPRPSGRGAPPPAATITSEGDGDGDEATPSTAMRRAGEALEAYDYEEARRHLDQALQDSGGAPRPAAALLGLLVETLGADGEALALEASLSRAALAAPGVRGLLALAAARTGDEPRALALVRGAEDAKAAAVFAALSAVALSAGDAARAQDHFEQARRRDPGHAALAGLGAEIARARAAERGPIEAELAALVAAGQDAEAEKKAGEALARWPSSEAARRALRAVEDRRRRAQAERLATEAEAALAAGDTVEARARLTRALAAARGPEREALERRVRALDAAERAAREAREVERVAGLLAAADPREGLLAYLELDEALRARTRERARLDAVRWLDLTGRGAPQARVDAVLALARARAQLARGDEEAAVTTLGPHLAALDRVPEAKQLTREAETIASARRAARAGEAVGAARAALAGGDAAAALRRLDEATLRDVPEADRDAAAALRAEAAAAVARADRIEQLARLRAAGKLFEARRVAEELAADAGDPARARWQAERRSLQAAIQRELRVEVDEERAPLDATSGLNGLLSQRDASRWLAPDGRSLVMAESHGRWVRVHVLDLADQTMRARVLLRLPEPTGQVISAVTGDTVWILGVRGGLLALSMETWEVKLHRPSAEILPPGTTAASSVFPVGDGPAATRFLWIEPTAPDVSHSARVLDLEQRRLGREVPEAARVTDVPGARQPRVVCFRGEGIVLHDHRGATVPGGRITVPGATPVGVALHPDGKSLVVLVKPGAAPGRRGEYAWVVVPEGGPPGPLHPIEGSDEASIARIAGSSETGIVAVQFRNAADEDELLVLGVSADGLAPLYRVPLSRTVLLVQDARGRRLLAVESPVTRPIAVQLGQSPPELPPRAFIPRPWIDHVIDVVTCIDYKRSDQIALRELGVRLAGFTAASRAAFTRNYQQGPDPSVDYGFTIVNVLEGLDAFGKQEAQRLLAWMFERFPRDPETRLQHANRLARAGQWAEVERLFDASLDTAPRSAHFYHLLALAALHAGDPERARARLAEARARFSPALCTIGPLEELLSPVPDPLAPATEVSSLAQLAEDARAADRCLARDDAAGALAALSGERYWTYGDVQLLARMAEAQLRLAPRRGHARFQKVMTLARFVEEHDEKDPEQRREMPIPGATWDRARLDEVAERARAWLAGVGEGEG
jgi:hypothetical protein